MLYAPDRMSFMTSVASNHSHVGCDNAIGANSPLYGLPAALGDRSCQTSCRGNANEACGSLDSFVSIYEYTVSGISKKCLCAYAFVSFLAFWRRRGATERSEGEEVLVANRLGRWAGWERGLGGGSRWRGPWCRDPGDSNLQLLFLQSVQPARSQ